MGRISLAWRILTSGAFTAKVTQLLDLASKPEAPIALAAPMKPIVPAKSSRSDAVNLLAALQREGRLIDFLKEPIEAYSDSQIGAAVRDIHRDCGEVLERQFAIRPVLDQAEGSSVNLSGPPKGGKIKLTGKVGEGSPSSGTLVHHGWKVSKSELPVWTGDADSASIVTPAEVEVR